MPGKNLKTFVDLQRDSIEKIHSEFGGKTFGLFTAHRLGIRVPETWIIGCEWFTKFCQNHPYKKTQDFNQLAERFIAKNFSTEFAALPDIEFAVRSSSQFEDSSVQSFAGIFESKLHVKKTDLIKAIAEVWVSCFSKRVMAYFDDIGDLKMAVVIQPMIMASYAGVCFSKHPSPSSALDDHHLLIEVAAAEGEKIVQGEITPLRFSGNVAQLAACVDESWMKSLLNAVLILKSGANHEIDMEFVVDKKQDFYLVQQRPVSTHYQAKALDLTDYFRAYKRTLYCLDIELLIEGCSLFLANYLEVPYQLNHWMIMTTTSEGTQKLWLNKIINQTVINKIVENSFSDEHYLPRMYARYFLQHNRILQQRYQGFFNQELSLEIRLLNWIEFMRPLHAHYYVPMFMIDALTQVLLVHMRHVDSQNAESDLMQMGTMGVRTLGDLLNEELLNLKDELQEQPFAKQSAKIQQKFQQLAQQYGFLKVHQVYEIGYTPEELFAMTKELITEKRQEKYDEKLYEKYITNGHIAFIFDQFKQWMNIRNQQMEYLMYAVLASRPLIEEISQALNIEVKQLWSLSRETIINSIKNNSNNNLIKKFSTDNLVIFREDGKTRVTNQLKVIYASDTKQAVIKGKTIYGTGKLTAKVKIAFRPDDLKNFSPSKDEKYILVTGMTTPDYVPYLRKNFAALITDEGGILCHAAIIAREIQIPAIVGTGIATEMLENDMRIEIDLDRGEIKVI